MRHYLNKYLIYQHTNRKKDTNTFLCLELHGFLKFCTIMYDSTWSYSENSKNREYLEYRDNKENRKNRENYQFMGYRESEYLDMCKKIKKKGLFAE